MNMLTISCPSCGLTRQMPFDKVPEGERRVTCPQCKQVFSFTKPLSIPPQDKENIPVLPVSPPPVPPPTQPAGTPSQTVPPIRKTPPPKPTPPPSNGLMDIGGLFNESWQIFQSRFATLIGLYLLSIVAFILPVAVSSVLAMFAGMAKGGSTFILAGMVGLFVGVYLGFRCFAAFLHAIVDDQLNFGDALKKGNEIILPLMWVGFLTSLIIGGGFILLIIPGVIFIVWFFFAQFILVQEGVHGMSALLKSREYVRGEWFNVTLRLLLVWAASLLLGAIPLAGPILYIVFFPYIMIFHYLVYRDLRRMKGDVPFPCSTSDKIKWPAVSLAGLIIVPIVLISFVGFSFMGKLSSIAPNSSMKMQKRPLSKRADSNTPQPATVDTPTNVSPAPVPSISSPSQPSGTVASLDNVSIFIYVVNYTGTIKANGVPIKVMEGKPDMQYNYNMFGNGLRYGQNQIQIDYSEIPNPPSDMLQIHMKISRRLPGKEKVILGEWHIKDKGTGTKTFTVDIPK